MPSHSCSLKCAALVTILHMFDSTVQGDSVLCLCCRLVQTTDGDSQIFRPGDIVFDDDTADSRAAKTPGHESTAVGDRPLNLLMTSVDLDSTIDTPCPFGDIIIP